jgi:hypothetical protein
MASGSKPRKTPAGADTNKQAKANSGIRRHADIGQKGKRKAVGINLEFV